MTTPRRHLWRPRRNSDDQLMLHTSTGFSAELRRTLTRLKAMINCSLSSEGALAFSSVPCRRGIFVVHWTHLPNGGARPCAGRGCHRRHSAKCSVQQHAHVPPFKIHCAPILSLFFWQFCYQLILMEGYDPSFGEGENNGLLQHQHLLF